MKTIGKHTLCELLPHMKEIATQYGLKINRAQDFEIIRKVLVQRFYSIPLWYDL
jgi:hypothetical protein